MFQTLAFIAISLSASEHKEVELIGFSNGEMAVAWQVTIERTHASHLIDKFSLIQVIRTTDQEVLAVYRGPRYWCSRLGRRAPCYDEIFARRNPDWGAAAAHEIWEYVAWQRKFSALSVDMKADALAIRAPPKSRVKRGEKMATIRRASGFSVVSRLANGKRVLTAHFDESRAQVKAWTSTTGMTVAVLSRSLSSGGEPVWTAKVTLLPSPLGVIRLEDVGDKHPALDPSFAHYEGYVENW